MPMTDEEVRKLRDEWARRYLHRTGYSPPVVLLDDVRMMEQLYEESNTDWDWDAQEVW